MKKQNFFKSAMLMVLVSASCFSCSDKHSDFPEQPTEQTAPEVGTSNTSDFPVVATKNGTLHFASAEEASKVSIQVANMSNADFAAWAEKIGFNSYRVKTDALIDEAYEIQDQENEVQATIELQAYLAQHANFIEQDDVKIKPLLNSHVYVSMTDENGIFYVENTKHIIGATAVTTIDESATTKSVGTPVTTEYVLGDITTKGTTTYSPYAARQGRIKDKLVETRPKYLHIRLRTESFLDIEIWSGGFAKSWGKFRPYKTTFSMASIIFTCPRFPHRAGTNGTGVGYSDRTFYFEDLSNSSGSSIHDWYVTARLTKLSIHNEFDIVMPSRIQYYVSTRAGCYVNYNETP